MINSLNKAIDILGLFSSAEPRLTLGEISRRLGLPKSTVYNLTATLLARGFLEKVDNDSYALGAEIIVLTHAVRLNVELRDRAAPLLRRLADTTHLSVYLTALDRGEGLYIYAVETSRRLLARTAVGDQVPLHCTSVGKAILGHLPEQEAEEIIARGLPAFTPATIIEPKVLRHALTEIRERGYAIDAGEHEPGIYCVGAPIFNERGRVVGACSVSGVELAAPVENADPQGMKELADLVMDTAQEISRRMGYVSSSPTKIFTLSESGFVN